jgi:SpoVK/Ycf46/Vps4 family AAA+-type ATPase
MAESKPEAPAEHVVTPETKELWRKGNALFEESKYEDALKAFTDAIAMDAKYADAYFNRALTYRILNDFASAKKDLQVVMELQPKSADAPLLMGDIAEGNEDLIGARFWFEKALSLKPDYNDAKMRLEALDRRMRGGGQTYPGAGGATTQIMEKPGMASNETQIQEGQIKKVAFFKSNIKFSDVIGLEKVKQYLTENVIYAITEPELFKKYGKKTGLGTLLYGPPGTGKTYTIKAIAGEANANVIIAQINQIVDMYTGNTEKNLHAVFEQARKNPPCILFFDELDSLGMKRGSAGGEGGESSAMRLAINQFLVEMSGVESNPEGIYVLAATNTPWDIDPALKRSGRFGDRIYIAPPNYKDRKALLKYETKNKPIGRIAWGRLSRAMIGYSPADISRIADKAVMRPLLHEHKLKKGRKLVTSDFLAILRDKDFSGSSLDEWYIMVKKEVINKRETQIIDGKKQEIIKEGKLDAEEKTLYKGMIDDIKKNTSHMRRAIKKIVRFWAIYLF